ncbi:exonuclease SbcCD subunit D C-terminal domain-containing protein [uncultured Hymenobacter sp.]|uniref:exonuclease SbcCD subunit D C-terminal domain-containing protein n=1 Tax=uncultured Hymenobacter sp. TaxID=170016 RepID=UPI0035CA1D7C
MRVLHTADWHLGQRFHNGHERLDEHQCFLDWLLHTIEQERVEVLLVAGDVFDTGNPPAAARELYYNFLAHLRSSETCHDVVIVGGNHDSAATLNASASLLKALRVHVVGGVPAVFEAQCLTLPHGAAPPRLVVAAVPFLRDADVRHLVAGETTAERESRLREGIAAHYHRLADHLPNYRALNVPVLATGHLFAAGGTAGDAERDIHVGNLGQIAADAFPAAFDYVALGHLHRPQVVGGRPHIRYCGAPIPLSFSETGHPQQVLLLTFGGAGCPEVQALDVPCTRRLRRFRGPLEQVIQQISEHDNTGYAHEAWAEVAVESGLPWAVVQDQIREAWLQTNGQVRVLTARKLAEIPTPLGAFKAPAEPVVPHLDELTPRAVFEQLLDTKDYEPAARAELLATFGELLAHR